MNTTGLQPGDTALLQLADGTVRSLPVAGTVGDQYAAGDFSAPPRGYITLDTAEWLGGQAGFNRLYVQVEAGNDEAAIDAVATKVEDKVERTGRNIYRTNTNKTTEHPMESTVLALVGVLGVLGILIMFLSSSLIINTLNALLTQHRRQIGVMKLVGARGFNISVMYIALIVGYGIIALIIAVPLGVIAGYGLASFMGGMLSIDIQGFRVVPIAVLIQIVLAFSVSLIAGYFPVNAGAKMTVRRAISEDNPSGTKQPLWPGRSSGDLVYVAVTAVVNIDSQHVPPQSKAGFDLVHLSHGWSHLHRRFQCPCLAQWIYGHDEPALSGRCHGDL